MDDDDEHATSNVIGEMSPGSLLRNVSFKVEDVLQYGDEQQEQHENNNDHDDDDEEEFIAELSNANGLVRLAFHGSEHLHEIIQPGNKILLKRVWVCCESDGKFLLRLDDSDEVEQEGEKESLVKLVPNMAESKYEPPVKNFQSSYSLVPRAFGLIVIRADQCLLARSPENHWEGFTIPSGYAAEDETERSACLRSVCDLIQISEEELYILHSVPPVMQYFPRSIDESAIEPGIPSTAILYCAYTRNPPPNASKPRSLAERLADTVDNYDWFSFDEAMQILPTEHEKNALIDCVRSLQRGYKVNAIRPSFDKEFGSSTTVINSLNTQLPSSEVLSEAAQIAAAYHLKMLGKINEDEFNQLLLLGLNQKAQLKDSPSTKSLTNNKKKKRTSKEKLVDEKHHPFRPLPVTVLSGFLGAGKTTLLKHLLLNKDDMKIALIVNDMAELNVDGMNIAEHVAQISEKGEDKVVQMQNGCICCTLREDLLEQIAELARSQKYDYLIIESSGISEPMPVAETFTFGKLPNSGETTLKALDGFEVLGDIAQLDTMVSVVDASNFMTMFKERGDLSRLLLDQVEFADVIILNKIDVTPESELSILSSFITKLNPDAKLIQTSHGKVNVRDVIHTKRFELSKAARAPGWLQELRGTHKPESTEYDISSFLFRSKLPFHVQRLKLFTQHPYVKEHLLRSKGISFIASETGMNKAIEWAHAGNRFHFTIVKDWNTNTSSLDNFGDRQQEIVLIGKSMNHDQMRKLLNEALISEDSEEFEYVKQGDWAKLGNTLDSELMLEIMRSPEELCHT